MCRRKKSQQQRKSEKMKRFKYLIIGGGMTAASAVSGIREVDSTGGIAEPGPFGRNNLKGRLK